jgi:modulator of FtsH protease
MSSRDTTVQPVEVARDEARALFAHTMTLVAITAAFFAGGAYLGRDMSQGAGLLVHRPFACLFGIRFALERSSSSPSAALGLAS